MYAPHMQAQARKWASTSLADHSPGAGGARSCAGPRSRVRSAKRGGVAASMVRICGVVRGVSYTMHNILYNIAYKDKNNHECGLVGFSSGEIFTSGS